MRSFLASIVLSGCLSPSTDDASEDLLDRSSESVTFSSTDLDLEGSLLLPERYASMPVPGIVLVHGSGPIGRDGEVAGQLNMGFGFTLSVYKEVSKALQNAGFAVLRYDKRSCMSSNGCDNS